MNKLSQLISLCKCGVYLTINNHKDVYCSVEQWLNDMEDIVPELVREIPKEMVIDMIKLDTIIQLDFYPETPVGFFRVFDTDLERIIDKALEIINKHD